MEKTISRCHFRPLLLESLHELALGLQDVVDTHHGPPGQEVGIDVAFVEEECQHLLFGTFCMDLGFDMPTQALL